MHTLTLNKNNDNLNFNSNTSRADLIVYYIISIIEIIIQKK